MNRTPLPRPAASVWHPDRVNTIVITCGKGMAGILRREVEALGCSVGGSTETGVSTVGSLLDTLRLNLHLRTAHRVLWQVGEGVANHPDALYQRLVGWPWETWIPSRGNLCVTASGQSMTGDDPRFVALKTKDAIVDRILHTAGHRPDAGPDRTGSVVHLHWEGRFFTAYLDTSGESLSHRTYRHQPHTAPMRETLAAACLLGAGWNPDTPLVNPMCGGGTLAIEAALMASHTPPGWLRGSFGFHHIVGFPADRWEAVRAEAARAIRPHPSVVRIIANDHDPKAVDAARGNAQRAGIAPWIHFSECDFAATPLPAPPGLIIFNPEYGERLGADQDLAPHYRAIGDYLKQSARGYTGAVFTGNAEMIKAVGLKPRLRLPLFNGPIEGRLLIYDLYDGTRRDRRLRPGGRAET
jgi:putative N6-adenine-specific DNA methylase